MIEGRFNLQLTGNNRIIPSYALGQVRDNGGVILAQMTVTESAFPIENDSDWRGKWVIWRTFYSVAFHMAREFDVERFSSHNEPNHPASFIDPEPWLQRLRIASDAIQAAIEDVNALYDKDLTPRIKAPVSAGTVGAGHTDYGIPALASIDVDFRGAKPAGFQLFHTYAYQTYSSNLTTSARDFSTIDNDIRNTLPSHISPLPIAITEFNVHTGANYDAMIESSDTLSRAVRFGNIVRNYAAIGVNELFAFKFGLTSYNGNFPVQKNGMLFTDNVSQPFNHGSMTRSAEVYRLFNKGFGPGANILRHTVSGQGADRLQVMTSFNPTSNVISVFSVNESGSSQPMELDLTAFQVPNGNTAIIEDVSQWRSGVIRSVETINNGLLQPGNQPDQTVWLITIPVAPQTAADNQSTLHAIPASQGVMVRDGSFANVNLAGTDPVYARNHGANADERAAVFLQFDLPQDWNPDDLVLAVLNVPIAPLSAARIRYTLTFTALISTTGIPIPLPGTMPLPFARMCCQATKSGIVWSTALARSPIF
ncbi:MAG: hypothetical protein LR015_13700 [Verrucomicrobia bacterium]|nr:hypothetical protein [Verrucomicrobiota bacterium]